MNIQEQKEILKLIYTQYKKLDLKNINKYITLTCLQIKDIFYLQYLINKN